MASGDASDTNNNGQASLGAMSIARLIPRFTRPRLLTNNIPTYRQSFSRPIQQHHDGSASDAPAATVQSEHGPPSTTKQPAAPSYIEWSQLLPTPSNLLRSFHDLFAPQDPPTSASNTQAGDPQQNGTGATATPLPPPPPRLVFFGEQHHQPHVMRAQLQTLHALSEQCRALTNREDVALSSKAAPEYRLHLVFEHFSVLDQEMLTSFSHGKIGPDELANRYQAESKESFHIGHYMPLLMLARELDVPIWGGFPPRQWARQVFRDGVDAVKADEQQRVDSTSKPATANPFATIPTPSQGRTAATLGSRPPLFTAWDAVTKISAAHRSYLSGLMRPDLPPRFPQLPGLNPSQASSEMLQHSPLYPTWLLKQHLIEAKGFGPAQALKDSYLAHVTAWIIRAFRHDTERPIVNVVLVVCGLGHCEYGFGAPERVVQFLSSNGDDAALPYIIASKPLDSGIWLGDEHGIDSKAAEPPVSDPAQQNAVLESKKSSPHEVQRWLNDPWSRKMADAVVLYDWIDDEPTDEASASADGHQPATTT